MELLPVVLSSLVTSIPSVIVDVALLVVAILRWNRHPRISMLASTSAVLLLLLDVLARAAFAVMPYKLEESGRSMASLGVLYAVLGGASSLLHALALTLLVVAVFSERGPAPSPSSLGR